MLDAAGWLESTAQRDLPTKKVKKVRGGGRQCLAGENLQSFRHVGYRNSFQAGQRDLQGERQREPKLEMGSTLVCRFFPEKSPANITVVYSESIVNVGYGPKGQNLKKKRKRKRLGWGGTWMRKSGRSSEVERKRYHEGHVEREVFERRHQLGHTGDGKGLLKE